MEEKVNPLLANSLYRGSYLTPMPGSELPNSRDFAFARKRLQDDYDYNVSLRQTGITNSSVERGITLAKALLDGRSEWLDRTERNVEAERKRRQDAAKTVAAKAQADNAQKVAAVLKDQSKGLPISQEAKLTAGILKSSIHKPLPKLKKKRRRR